MIRANSIVLVLEASPRNSGIQLGPAPIAQPNCRWESTGTSSCTINVTNTLSKCRHSQPNKHWLALTVKPNQLRQVNVVNCEPQNTELQVAPVPGTKTLHRLRQQQHAHTHTAQGLTRTSCGTTGSQDRPLRVTQCSHCVTCHVTEQQCGSTSIPILIQ